jgi:hypothetical protein
MKRDWDLVRRILLTVEEAAPGAHVMSHQFPDLDNPTLFEHVKVLKNAGYLEAQLLPLKTGHGGDDFVILGLPWDGHDLLAKMRSDTWWAKIKATAKEKGIEFTFDVVKTLAGPAAAAVLGIPT